ncbi:MAG: hypothetical protein ACR2RF_26155 [Geminicoccaceae bacterium]
MSGHTPTGFLERQPVEVTTSAGDAVLVRGYDSRLYPDNERVTIMNCVTNAGAQLPAEICEANAAYAAACWNAFLGSELPADRIEQGMVGRLCEINGDLLEALFAWHDAYAGWSDDSMSSRFDPATIVRIKQTAAAIAKATPNTATGDER